MKNLVRDPTTGEPLLCCWDDCGQYGDDREAEMYSESGTKQKEIRYIFCSTAHRAYWNNSHRSNGNLPSGFRNVWGLR